MLLKELKVLKGMASDVTDDNEPKNISDDNQDTKKKNKSHAYYWLV